MTCRDGRSYRCSMQWTTIGGAHHYYLDDRDPPKPARQVSAAEAILTDASFVAAEAYPNSTDRSTASNHCRTLSMEATQGARPTAHDVFPVDRRNECSQKSARANRRGLAVFSAFADRTPFVKDASSQLSQCVIVNWRQAKRVINDAEKASRVRGPRGVGLTRRSRGMDAICDRWRCRSLSSPSEDVIALPALDRS